MGTEVGVGVDTPDPHSEKIIQKIEEKEWGSGSIIKLYINIGP